MLRICVSKHGQSVIKASQGSEKLGKFLSKWKRETEARKFTKAEQFGELAASW